MNDNDDELLPFVRVIGNAIFNAGPGLSDDEKAAAVLATPEMQAVKSVLKSYARPSLTRQDLTNKGLPDSIIEWVIG